VEAQIAGAVVSKWLLFVEAEGTQVRTRVAGRVVGRRAPNR
jgi:hypothetical protein